MGKLYAHDKAKIAANRATAGERNEWNKRIEREKDEREKRNASFMPRKASHKQGWKRPEVRSY